VRCASFCTTERRLTSASSRMAFPLAAWRIAWVWSTKFGVKLTAAFDEISDLHRPAPLLAVPEAMFAEVS
jgi:hypothetical protein